jgi:hypothetical protein
MGKESVTLIDVRTEMKWLRQDHGATRIPLSAPAGGGLAKGSKGCVLLPLGAFISGVPFMLSKT